jgi:predicted dehydrogenase
MIRVGLLGFGYWGPNLARAFQAHPEVRLEAICDLDAGRCAQAVRHHPGARILGAAELLAGSTVDCIAIATPAAAHFAMARDALRAGKHVFVEKPLATRVDEAERLVEEAARRRLVLMVDHTFLFAPPVRKLAELVDAGELGTLRYFDAVRIALGRFQSDVNVLWDLAVHDLAVLDRLTPEAPAAISAHGAAHLPGQREDIAFVTLRYASGFIAHLHVNWLAPVKLRRALLGGSWRTALWDDLEPSERLRVYDSRAPGDQDESGEGEHQRHVGFREGDMWSPHLEVREPLADAVAEFVRAVAQGTPQLSGGESGLRVVRLLAAADASLARGGAVIELVAPGRPDRQEVTGQMQVAALRGTGSF